MCGIVGAIAEKKRDITHILLDGLLRLEYRGYDSAGVVLMNGDNKLRRKRAVGKVERLIAALDDENEPMTGHIGVAHTRWATHGEPSETNAHPHMSADEIAIVHNGIIENYQQLKQNLIEVGYQFVTQTDSEVIAHLIHQLLHQQTQGNADLLLAVKKTVDMMEGAFAIAVIFKHDSQRLIAARKGAPLVIGLGRQINYVASDPLALLPQTHRFIYLQEGDIVDLHAQKFEIFDKEMRAVKRDIHELDIRQDVTNKGQYRHFMLKEIMEQPQVIEATLIGRISHEHVLEQSFGIKAEKIFEQVKNVQIVACGTSYHAGLIARYWLEELAGIACRVEVASEIRYRKTVVADNTLFIVISQSGETADSLAALRQAKELNYLASLAICNVPESTIVRESDLVLMTQAGTEIGVASTKAFTTQLVSLMLLTIALGRRYHLTADKEKQLVAQLHQLPQLIEQTLKLDDAVKNMAQAFANRQHALFLGRHAYYPVAMEGALKLKEISYIHAEAYPAGELKHGPLALVDQHMPVVAIIPNDELIEKIKSNLQEVRARGGLLYAFVDEHIDMPEEKNVHCIRMPAVPREIAPIIYTIPLQLLAYHVAVLKGTDVDQPRNLAKSVTVE